MSSPPSNPSPDASAARKNASVTSNAAESLGHPDIHPRSRPDGGAGAPIWPVNRSTTPWPNPSSASTRLSSSPLEDHGAPVEDVELATLGWVHWFNHDRLMWPIGGVPPAEFEARWLAKGVRPQEARGAPISSPVVSTVPPANEPREHLPELTAPKSNGVPSANSRGSPQAARSARGAGQQEPISPLMPTLQPSGAHLVLRSRRSQFSSRSPMV